MTSKCGKNKQVAHEAIVECVIGVLTRALQHHDGIYFTHRFHVAVRLFSNRSQITSKCGKNKKVTHGVAECVIDALTTF